MDGHQAILKMRIEQRIKPPAVFINDFPCEPGLADPETVMPSVCVHKDAIQGLDLRFLAGMRVHVISLDVGRARGLYERVIEFQPFSVIACHVIPGTRGVTSLLLAWTKEQGVIDV